MNPFASYLLDSLSVQSLRYVIPVYQRKYSWDEEHCFQLWEDVISIGRADGGNHFTGSIVWVQNGAISGSGDISALLIDGQQRMTTISLLLLALARYAKDNDGLGPDGNPLTFNWEDILEDYLLHKKRSQGIDRYKLTLSEEDNETFHSLIDNLKDSSYPIVEDSARVINNYGFFRKLVAGIANPDLIWLGLRRLQVISVSLEPGSDNPQAIFESMNSTGKDLAAADLVRNYVLMRLTIDVQNKLYKNYWRRIELALGTEEDAFDSFLHDYLTLQNAPANVNPKDAYAVFKRMCTSRSIDDPAEIEALLSDMLFHAQLWSKITLCTDANPKRNALLNDLRILDITVANPLLLAFYRAAQGENAAVSDEALTRLVGALESYLMRRAICGQATNSLNKLFPSIIAKLEALPEGIDYEQAFYALLEIEAGTSRCFPDDAEFVAELKTKNVYSFKKCMFLLNKLENSIHPKNPMNFFTGCYSIEHIMPQNALAHDEWVKALGGSEEAPAAHASLVHRLGNLTVTAYNSELSDGTFEAKKTRMIGGYDNDVISLSADVATKECWNPEEIERRGALLAEKAVAIWAKPQADPVLVDAFIKKPIKAQGKPTQTESLSDLLSRGALKAGDKLIRSSASGDVTAVITEAGMIRLQNGDEFSSPSAAAGRANALLGGTGSSFNGWDYWSIDQNGILVPLKSLRKEATKTSSAALTETQRLRVAFWNGFNEYCSDSEAFTAAFGDFSERKENKGAWTYIGIGKNEVNLDAMVYFDMDIISVDAWFRDGSQYVPYWENRSEIGKPLEGTGAIWDDLECDKKSRKVYVEIPWNLKDESTWEGAYKEIVSLVWKFKEAFGN